MREKTYHIDKVARVGTFGNYYVWILVELSIPDETNSFYQRSKSIAEFGNTKDKDNHRNVKKVKQFFENELYKKV